MITIFAVPREFEGEFDVIQRNGIKSWTLLKPECEVILFGNEKGTAEVARELGVVHIPDLKVNEFGSPMLEDMIDKARERLAAIVDFPTPPLQLMTAILCFMPDMANPIFLINSKS